MEDLKQFRAQYAPKIDATMVEYLTNCPCNPLLKEAMLYSVEAGGKRLRPLLILAVLQCFNLPIDEAALKVSAAVEYVHTYSLIHDDLPEMDNDDYRRGKLTNHKVYGQAMAVLAGDGLLTLSFNLLANTNLPAELQITLVQALSFAAGAQGMINGQVGDILGEKQKLTLAELKAVHQGKTGALLTYCCQAGGLLAYCTSDQLVQLQAFGAAFGLAFQIYDDILDVIGDEKVLGKAVHKDSEHHKNTYVGLLSLDGAIAALKEAKDQAAKAIDNLQKITNNQYDFTLLLEFLNYFEV